MTADVGEPRPMSTDRSSGDASGSWTSLAFARRPGRRRAIESSRCACRTDRCCRRVDFDRHVASLFGRLGCNAGACHGSFQGRGGLNLSLFGHDPARDFQALTREALGRRVERARPRPQPRPAQADRPGPARGRPAVHGRLVGIPGHPRLDRRRAPARPGAGGRRANRDPPRHLDPRTAGRLGPALGRRPVRRWRPKPTSPRSATSTSGTTPSSTVAPGGEVRGLRPGDTAVVASYNGQLASARVSVPTGRVVTVPDVPAVRPDRPRGLRQAPGPGHRTLGTSVRRRVPPPGHARRHRHAAHSAGGPRLPRRSLAGQAVEEDRRAARAPDARRALGHAVPRHHRLRRRVRWKGRTTSGPAGRGCGTTGSASGSPRTRPTTEIARGVLYATSRDGERRRRLGRPAKPRGCSPLKNGAARPTTRPSRASICSGGGSPTASTSRSSSMAERTAAAFLGVRIECAQCHKHPFDRWTQADYRGVCQRLRQRPVRPLPRGLGRDGAAARGAAEVGPGRHAAADPPAAARRLRRRATFAAAGRSRDRPAASRPGRSAGRSCPPSGDPRERLFAWLIEPDNPYFARELRQPRLGRLLRRRAGRPGRRLLGRQPALERPAARRARGRLRRARLRHPPAGAIDPRARAPTSGPRARRRATSTTAATSPAPSRGR